MKCNRPLRLFDVCVLDCDFLKVVSLNNDFANLVFLAFFLCVLIFPPNIGLTTCAVDIADFVEAGEHLSFFCLSCDVVQGLIEEVCGTRFAVEVLGHHVIFASEMCLSFLASENFISQSNCKIWLTHPKFSDYSLLTF